MRVAIQMPKVGYDMTTGKIISWLKEVGEPIRRGEAIAEIETDKVVIEMEALSDGILAEIVCAAGAEVPIGEAIAYLEDGT
jgi:pyruvate dehydrogenase E2 component (dihydrolipoamide acetyltransferase)